MITRQPRLVTVCIEGDTAKRTTKNESRHQLLRAVVEAIEQRGWTDIDAIVFPGGYFYLHETLGSPLAVRERVLKRLGFVGRLQRTCRRLSSSPGALIVVGMDRGRGRDQYCVAFGASGLAGVARKIFPTKLERRYVCDRSDYDDSHRIVNLPSGHAAVLCACYDMFGIGAVKRGWPGTKHIRRLAGSDDIRRDRRAAITSFETMLAKERVSVGIVAIHKFPSESKSERSQDGVVLWQRHGLATCSAALGRGYAIGAAHFTKGLPARPEGGTLAAKGVAARHMTLSDKRNRGAHNWGPADSFRFENMLVRLFESGAGG